MNSWRPVGEGTWVGTDASDRFPIYTRGNAGEVYPEVFTPLSFSMAAAAGEQAFRHALLASGLIRPEELAGIPLTTGVGSGVFGGYAYLNLSVQRLAAARFPGGKAEDADSNYLGVGDPPPHVPMAGERNIKASLAGLRYVWKTVRTSELPQLAADQLRVDEFLSRLPNVDSATDEELRQSVVDMMALFAELFETHLTISGAAGLTVTALTQMCEKQLHDADLAVQLLVGLGEVDSAAPSAALWPLSRTVADSPGLAAQFDDGVGGLLDRLETDPDAAPFLHDFDEFIAEFGSRGPNEWDTAFDTWETDPSLALALIDRMRGAEDSRDPRAQRERLMAEASALEIETLARLKRPSRSVFARVLSAARLYSRSRERTKTTVVKAIHGARLRAKELDRRLCERSGGERGDLWFVVHDELDDYVTDPIRFASTISQRRRQHGLLAERIPPFFFDRVQPPLAEWEHRGATRTPVTAGELIEGLPGCKGVARGRARIVLDPSDPGGFEPGDVLVAPLTDPSWTPLFVPAQAIVVDVGAVMSHAVIVSRELGIPCAVSVTDATRRIPDGALIEVDGNTGVVTVVELP